ncbi:MAG: hypothetical protein K6C32_00455 [Bacilli bacterium]|nr:hypothetical protein [Bacilli bacterium]
MELSRINELLKEKLLTLGYELVSLNLSHANGEKTLSIVVDRVEPIDMDAIVELSHNLNAYIDEINPIEDAYTLDISSLGAEKPLKVEELDKYVDRYVNVHIINPINGLNIYEGTLVSVSNESITLSYREKTRTKTVDILKENISKIRLAIKF